MIAPVLLALSIAKSPTSIPKSEIVLDGRISDNEHKGALTKVYPSGTLLLSHDDKNLNIGIKTSKMGIASVFLATGKDLLVLHASAALATAKYQVDGPTGKCVKPFQHFSLRAGTNPSPEAKKKFYENNRWLANARNANEASFDREFQISLSLIDPNKTRIFIAYDSMLSNSLLANFPSEVGNYTNLLQLIRGYTEDVPNMDSSKWTTLKFL